MIPCVVATATLHNRNGWPVQGVFNRHSCLRLQTACVLTSSNSIRAETCKILLLLSYVSKLQREVQKGIGSSESSRSVYAVRNNPQQRSVGTEAESSSVSCAQL